MEPRLVRSLVLTLEPLHPYLAEDLGVVFECVGMILLVRKLKMVFSDR